MNGNELKKWVIENNIKQRTIESFWRCFEKYKVESPDEYDEYFGLFDKGSLTIWTDKIALKIMNWDTFYEEYNENHEFIEAYLKLEYKNKYIGYYSLLFNFSGETFDDYFVLE
ncbi:hypothetical protein N4T77_01640 [Clostridium sp. CX1]|uniref:Uncharacterized protein n=1 Tax=Clostridium tanneri TaxID=3037988 RepID=A0ABU4JPY8_9CLOT|nr:MULTISPECIES: hypothetical protein [unclassified Clostridium]MCT8975292.1 hypothetical protein [Clostridium sp. CX1]MDW8800216.1 hypothetical protein [Clostridium sp. A1-XYC3]